jgi:hypothetical protein
LLRVLWMLFKCSVTEVHPSPKMLCILLTQPYPC